MQTDILTDTENRVIPVDTEPSSLYFTYLPGYATFLMKKYLLEFTNEQIRIAKEVKMPLLTYFKTYNEEELFQLGRKNTLGLLISLSRNTAPRYIAETLQRFVNNQLPPLQPDQVVAEDITLASYIRRKAFRRFMPFYTTDSTLSMNIMQEADRLTLELDTHCLHSIMKMQQRLYREAQSIAKLGNWFWDVNSGQLNWSDEIYHIYEIDPSEEISYELVSELYHPDDREGVKQRIQLTQETLVPLDYYFRVILRKGTQKVLHVRGEVKVDDNGLPAQLFGTVQDVTEQRQIEEELINKQIFIRKVADICPSLLAVYDVNTGKYAFINRALETLLGYEPAEVMSEGSEFFMSRIHPDDLPMLTAKNTAELQKYQGAIPKSGEPLVEFRYRVRHKSGNYRWLHSYGTVFDRDSAGQIIHVINASVDVTDLMTAVAELEKMNEELRRSEERYHKMTEEVQDYAIILLDKEGYVMNWNAGAEKIKGYQASEIIGKHFRSFYSEEDKKKRIPEKLLIQASTEGKATHEGWRLRKDGTRFWSNTVLSALHDNENNVIGFTKLSRDLTEKKLIEDRIKQYTRQLIQQNRELEMSNQDLASFSYIASHDLQEPLRKIQSFAQLLIDTEKTNLTEKGQDYLNRMHLAAARMQNLIKSLLAFSIATTSPKSDQESTDLNHVLEEAKSALKMSIEESRAEIIADKLPIVTVIPFQFQQVMQNLLSNAIKYRNPEVQPIIEIRSSRVKSKEVPGALSDKNYVKITVADNGIGFDPEDKHRIFDLFQRLHGKSHLPGAGIGLAICKRIIQNHHGFISANAEPGKGATFEIYLPVED